MFADHQRLHRHSPQILMATGRSSRGWLAQCAELLDPLYQWMKKELLGSKVIGTDDTSVKVLDRKLPFAAQARAARYSDRAALVKDRINAGLWYPGDGQMLRYMAPSFSTANLGLDSLGVLVDESYYLPYVGFRAVGEWFDTLGNLLAIVSGVAEPSQEEAIFSLIERHGLADMPLRAIYPPIGSEDPDWRPYYGALNHPNCYHNGGVWPFIGGFYVAALVKSGRQEAAASALRRLALLNRRGGFNEWHHGTTGEPMGVPEQAWSAGMYLYARECVRRGRLLFL